MLAYLLGLVSNSHNWRTRPLAGSVNTVVTLCTSRKQPANKVTGNQSNRITTPSGLDIECQEISESDRKFGTYVTYCKRYWGTQMEDYGTTTCQEADKYIDDHKLVWKEQAERSKTRRDAEENGNSDGYEDARMSEDIDVSEDDPTHIHDTPSMESAGQMENLATNADYHQSCRLLYATTQHPSSKHRDPILIRAEYSRIYDRLMFLHSTRVCNCYWKAWHW